MELDDIRQHLERLDEKLDAALRLNRSVLDRHILDKVDKALRDFDLVEPVPSVLVFLAVP